MCTQITFCKHVMDNQTVNWGIVTISSQRIGTKSVKNINMEKRERKGNRFNRKDWGPIGRLDEHTLAYYRRVSDSLEEGFESDEDKGMNSF